MYFALYSLHGKKTCCYKRFTCNKIIRPPKSNSQSFARLSPIQSFFCDLGTSRDLKDFMSPMRHRRMHNPEEKDLNKPKYTQEISGASRSLGDFQGPRRSYQQRRDLVYFKDLRISIRFQEHTQEILRALGDLTFPETLRWPRRFQEPQDDPQPKAQEIRSP